MNDASTTSPGGLSRRTWLDAVLLLVLTLVAFSSALPNRWIWDDNDYVTHNETLESSQGLRDIWFDVEATPQYYPLVHTSFWLERRLWGTETLADGRTQPRPFGYHLDNVLLHALAAILLWRVLRRLRVVGAWFAAAAFALHPVTVESVAWVTERKNVLSLVFALAAANAFLAYVGLRSVERDEREQRDELEERPGWRPLALAALFFLCALLSKTVVASLPAVLLLLLWWKGVRLEKRVVVPLVVLLAVGATLGWMTAQLEIEKVGAQGIKFEHGFLDRTIIAGRACWFYLSKLVAPIGLLFIYPRWEIDAGEPLQWLWPATAVALIVGTLLASKRIGRAPIACILIFGGVLFPALGYLNVYPHEFSFVADHFQYHACVAMIVLLAAALARVKGFQPCGMAKYDGPLGGEQGWVTLTAWGLLLATLGGLTWFQCRIYADKHTLWTHTVEHNPGASIAWNNLGVLASATKDERGEPKRADMREAYRFFEKAVETDELHLQARNNLAQVLLARGDVEEAERVLLRAVEIEPRYLSPHVKLGAIYAGRNELEKARHHFEVANARNEELSGVRIPRVCAALGALDLAAGDLPAAEDNLRFALTHGVTEPQPHLDFARALHRQGKIQKAMQAYEACARIPAVEAQSLIAATWIRASHEDSRWRNASAAMQLAQQLERRFRNAPAALDAAAAAYAESGRFEDARRLATQAASLARRAGREDVALGIDTRLRLYDENRTYRSPLGLPE